MKRNIVKNEENPSDEAMTTEEKPEEESQDANTTQVEGTREVPEEADTQAEAVQEPAEERMNPQTLPQQRIRSRKLIRRMHLQRWTTRQQQWLRM